MWYSTKMSLLFLRKVTKLLLVAVVLQAVVPSFAAGKVRSAGTTDSWSEVCTALGTKWVKQPDNSSSEQLDENTPQAHHASGDHCVFCSSTEALSLNNAPLFCDDHTTHSTFLSTDALKVSIFSGHNILSRAPPR
jgi:hypothetical protein